MTTPLSDSTNLAHPAKAASHVQSANDVAGDLPTERGQGTGGDAALLVRIAELEHSLADRTAQLAATRHELETFSFSISHDLRSPLRSIAGFSRMLSERHGQHLNADGQRLLHVVREEAGRMGNLIDDILRFSRVNRQELDPSPIDMADLARCVFEQLTETAPTVAKLEVGALPEGCGDRVMVRQVLVNLLGNALKFSSRQAAPVIEVSGHRDGTHTIYRVRDNGVGFNPEYSDRLFCAFQRLHSQSDFEGSGMGLALVQRIVRRHGGTVWAEGTVDGGASFYFSLPLEPKPSPRSR